MIIYFTMITISLTYKQKDLTVCDLIMMFYCICTNYW